MVSEEKFGKKQTNLSFAGCGFLGIYHVGVASCIRQYAPHMAADKIAGASAGAIAAVGLVCGVDLGKATTQVLELALRANTYTFGPFNPRFSIVSYLKPLLDEFLPYDAHKTASGRVYISLTRLIGFGNVVVSQFDTRDDLMQAMICSSYIPYYCGLVPPKYQGTYYIDGGLSNNIPRFDDDTITVSPFAGESDICPQDSSPYNMNVFLANTSIQLSSANLYRFSCIVFPPSPETLSKMCQQGFEDCLTYLKQNNVINCTRHISVYSSFPPNTLFAPSDPELADTQEAHKSDKEKDDTKEREEPNMRHKLQDVCEEELPSTSALDQSSDADTSEVDRDVDAVLSAACSMVSLWSDDEDETSDCADCNYHRERAVPDSLPAPVVRALQAACDSVHIGLNSGLRRMRAFRILAMAAMPAYLPLELTYTLAKRFYELAPHMPAKIRWCRRELRSILNRIYEYLQENRSSYSARFTCQLAITELDYSFENSPYSGISLHNVNPVSRTSTSPPNSKRHLNVAFSTDVESQGVEFDDPLKRLDELRHRLVDEEDDHDVVVMSLPPSESVELEVDVISDRSTLQTLRPRSASFSSTLLNRRKHRKHSAHEQVRHRLNKSLGNVNDSEDNHGNQGHHEDSLRLNKSLGNLHDRADNHGNQLHHEEALRLHQSLGNVNDSEDNHGNQGHHEEARRLNQSLGNLTDTQATQSPHHGKQALNQQVVRHSLNRSLDNMDSSVDTFENCLQIVTEMNSVLCYHYTQEDRSVRVAEIFKLKPERPLSDIPAAWDNRVEEDGVRDRKLSTSSCY